MTQPSARARTFLGACLGAGVWSGLAALAALLVAAAPRAAAAAESLEEFYRNRTVKVIVGSEAGGGYDIYARILVKYMGKHIPGNPTFVVQNMVGAGSISATNNIYNVQPQDGSVFGIIQRSALFSQILGETGALYDVTKFNWMGSANNEAGIMYTWHTAKVKTFDDLTKHDSLFGASGPNESEAFPSMLVNMIGARIKVIAGYGSNSAVNLAIERGEVEGIAQSWSTLRNQHPDWIRDKKVNLLAQMSLTKDPDMPAEVPLIMDLVGPHNLKPDYTPAESDTLWRIMLAQKAMGRPFVMGPGVPPDRVAVLRKAFDLSLKEPGYLEDAAKAKIEVTPVSGEEIQAMVTRLATTPKATLEKLERITKHRSK